MVRAAPQVRARALVCALTWSIAACGAELAQEPEGAAHAEPPSAAPPPARVRSKTLAIQRRADGLEQVSLQGRPQHVTVARIASDGGVQHQCASDAP